MAKEIERKFLIDLSKLNLPNNGQSIQQGYIETTSNTAVRIRMNGDQAYLTIKGENQGATRSEFEYPIPVRDAQEMLIELCQKPYIAKTRYEIPLGDHTWEIDVFEGENQGLCVAEIELASEDDPFQRPEWITQEVTGETKYYNSSLISLPFKLW